jgi:hypothetical protein
MNLHGKVGSERHPPASPSACLFNGIVRSYLENCLLWLGLYFDGPYVSRENKELAHPQFFMAPLLWGGRFEWASGAIEKDLDGADRLLNAFEIQNR